MKLWEYLDTKVRITLDDGKIIEGIVDDYTDDYGAGEEYDSITIGNYYYPEDQIEKIEIIND